MYVEINLLPESFYKAKKQKKIIFLSVIGGGIIVVFFIALYVSMISEISFLKKEIENVKSEQAKFVDVLNKIDAIKKDKTNLEERLKIINTLINLQAVWPKLLDDLNRVVPDTVYLKVVSSKAEGTGKSFSIEGIAVSKSAVADFLYSLQSSNYFTNIVLVTLADSGKSAIDRVTFKIICSSKI